MGMDGWRQKWAAFRAELVRRSTVTPRLTLVTPKRASGPVPRIIPEDWFSEREQQAMGALPVCRGCADWVVVGEAGLVDGRYCARCAGQRGIPFPPQHEQPPAA